MPGNANRARAAAAANDGTGLSSIEDRLLTLIANQGCANPEKVASLQETLSRIRKDKATAELRLSRFVHGVQIEPLNVQPQEEEFA